MDTGWEGGRFITQLELELGLGYRTPYDTLRCSVGYMFSGWYNVIQTDEWLEAVHNNNNFNGMGLNLSMDGFVLRLELRL